MTSKGSNIKEFTGTRDYITSAELRRAVRSAIILGKPLIVRGEPGTGKTALAYAIAKQLEMSIIPWNIKSTTKAQDGLYVYDTVQRLNDSRFGDKDVSDIKQYIMLGPLGKALNSEEQVVLLIDEIDKADIEFPNDLLNELDRMSFYITETKEEIVAKHRPIVIITSNAEKELPDAFLRRCLFHYIEFPDEKLMSEIVFAHFDNLAKKLLEKALKKFYELREYTGLKKKPSTSELLDWLQVLLAEERVEDFIKKGEDDPDLQRLEVLIKREDDLAIVNQRVSGRRSPTSYPGPRRW